MQRTFPLLLSKTNGFHVNNYQSVILIFIVFVLFLFTCICFIYFLFIHRFFSLFL